MKFQFAAIIVYAACGVSNAQAPDASRPIKAADSADVDEFVLRFMRRHHIPGASIAVISGGKSALIKSYGMANEEHRVPATESTAYQLASVTKTFTATMIMKLVRDGRVSL